MSVHLDAGYTGIHILFFATFLKKKLSFSKEKAEGKSLWILYRMILKWVGGKWEDRMGSAAVRLRAGAAAKKHTHPTSEVNPSDAT